jgi:hypothetical protein
MTLDKRSVDLLLTLDDAKLAFIIKKMMSDAGVDPSAVNLGKNELSGIRSALSSATDGDIARALELIESYKNGQRSP